MKRDIILILIYAGFLIAVYEMNSQYMQRAEKRTEDLHSELKRIWLETIPTSAE
jgi:hypothetical protein